MLLKNKNTKLIIFSAFLLSLLVLSIIIQVPGFRKSILNSVETNDYYNERGAPQKSETDYYSKDWITNGDFSSDSTNWTSEITGDSSDFTLGVSGGSANYIVEGDTGVFNFYQDPIDNNDGKWIDIQDPYFLTVAPPDSYGFNSYGMYIHHYFQEGTSYQQIATKVWARNCTVAQNLTDYTIVSASLTTYFNALVDRNIEVWAERYSGLTYWKNFDFAQFFLLLTDVDRTKVFQAGFFQLDNSTLNGQGTGTESVSDTLLPCVSEETLKYYLTEILSDDHQNFTIAFGIRVFCEDNRSQDYDYWERLAFKNVNITFTYEKIKNLFLFCIIHLPFYSVMKGIDINCNSWIGILTSSTSNREKHS